MERDGIGDYRLRIAGYKNQKNKCMGYAAGSKVLLGIILNEACWIKMKKVLTRNPFGTIVE